MPQHKKVIIKAQTIQLQLNIFAWEIFTIETRMKPRCEDCAAVQALA